MAEPTDTESLSEAAKISAQIKKIVDETKLTMTEINEGLERRKELEEELVQLELKKDSIAIKQRNIAQENLTLISSQVTLETELEKLRQKQIDDAFNLILNEEAALKLKSEIEEKEKAIAAVKDRQKTLDEEILSNQSKSKKAINDIEKKQKELNKNRKKYTDEAKKSAEENEDAFDVLSKYSKEIPIIGDAISKAFAIKANTKKFASFLGDMGEAIGSEKIANLGLDLAKNLGKMSNVMLATNVVVIGFIAYIGKMALEINNLSKELGAATGYGDQFNNEIRRMGTLGNLSGIGFKESADALKSLAEGLSSFNPTAEKTNEYIGLTVAQLQKLGVSSASSVKSMEHMQRSMGMTGKQAADATAQIARMGKEIGITGTKMIEDFNSASGRLAIYGKNNIKVFKELASVAKASGIEMQTLIGISEKFDKFDSAADSAAQLNAVLGTQLSTLEMMQATDSERILMLKQQVQMSVGNFDSLDKYTKQYIAQAMGVKDVAEAQKLLNMSTAEYQKYQQGQKESADIQKELSAETAKLVPIAQKLGLVLLQIAKVFTPIINGFLYLGVLIDTIYDAFASMNGTMSEFFGIAGTIIKYTLLIGGGFVAVATGVAPVIGLITGVISAFGALFEIFHKKGSPMLYQMPLYLADAFKAMGQALLSPISLVKGLAGSFSGLFDSLHPKDTGMNFDVEAMAKMDTTKVAKGFKDIKSALMELSTLKVDGFLAMTSDGNSSSFLMGSEGVLKSISEGKLTVDVKMPEMTMPDVSVKVYIGDRELRDIIKFEADLIVNKKIGRGG